jgi:hypothetical protein
MARPTRRRSPRTLTVGRPYLFLLPIAMNPDGTTSPAWLVAVVVKKTSDAFVIKNVLTGNSIALDIDQRILFYSTIQTAAQSAPGDLKRT